MIDTAYARSAYRPPEIEHRYGPSVHLLDDPAGWTLLARFCARDTQQPEVGRLLHILYERLAHTVLSAELPRARLDVPTRMVTSSPEAVVRSVFRLAARQPDLLGFLREVGRLGPPAV